MKYQLVEKPMGLTIVDPAGNPVSFDEAHQVINQLMDTYAHPAYVYVACRARLTNMEYKIGYSGQAPEQRMSQLRYQEKDDRIILLHTIACKSSQSALKLETEMHEWFEDRHIRGEWFYLNSNDMKLLMDIQSEGEANVKHLCHVMDLFIGIPPGEYIEWALSQPIEEQYLIREKATSLIATLNALEDELTPKQLPFPGF